MWLINTKRLIGSKRFIGGFTVKKVGKNHLKVVFYKILNSCIKVCPSMTAMTRDKGGGHD